MQIVRIPFWGFSYDRAEYYGRRHSFHIGPFLIFAGQMSDWELEQWHEIKSEMKDEKP